MKWGVKWFYQATAIDMGETILSIEDKHSVFNRKADI